MGPRYQPNQTKPTVFFPFWLGSFSELLWVVVLFSVALILLEGLSECRLVPVDLGPMVELAVDNPKVVSALVLTLLLINKKAN